MKTKFLALAFAALMPFAASADASYNYIDLSYQLGGELDSGGTIDTDGFLLKGSFAVNDNWFIQLDYNMLGTDPSGIDITDYALFAGWHGDMFFAKFGYESLELDLGAFGSLDDSGYTLDFGVRNMVSDAVELNAHVGYSDLGNWDTFTNYGLGAVWSVTDGMGVSFNYDLRSGDGIDFTTYGIGVRFNFD